MSTDERIVALEQGLAGVQRDFLVYLSESNHQMATLNKVVTAQELNNREVAHDVADVNHNVTMLLGVASGQERDIKAIRNDLGLVKERVESIGQRLGNVEQGIQQVLQQLAVLAARLGPEA